MREIMRIKREKINYPPFFKKKKKGEGGLYKDYGEI